MAVAGDEAVCEFFHLGFSEGCDASEGDVDDRGGLFGVEPLCAGVLFWFKDVDGGLVVVVFVVWEEGWADGLDWPFSDHPIYYLVKKINKQNTIRTYISGQF